MIQLPKKSFGSPTIDQDAGIVGSEPRVEVFVHVLHTEHVLGRKVVAEERG